MFIHWYPDGRRPAPSQRLLSCHNRRRTSLGRSPCKCTPSPCSLQALALSLPPPPWQAATPHASQDWHNCIDACGWYWLTPARPPRTHGWPARPAAAHHGWRLYGHCAVWIPSVQFLFYDAPYVHLPKILNLSSASRISCAGLVNVLTRSVSASRQNLDIFPWSCWWYSWQHLWYPASYPRV